MDYKYKIGDKVYYQKPLVLGQIKQLEAFMKNFIIPGDLNITTLMSLLGDKFPHVLSIVLIEEGKSLSARFHLSANSPLKRGDQGVCDSPLKRGDQGVCNSPLGRGAGVGDFGYEPLSEIMNMIALEIAVNIDLETSIQVLEDFFACNPTASIFQRLSGITDSLGLNLPPAQIRDPQSAIRNPQPVVSNAEPSEVGLMNSASSSLEGTSPGETTSSGDTPLPNASHISNTVSVT